MNVTPDLIRRKQYTSTILFVHYISLFSWIAVIPTSERIDRALKIMGSSDSNVTLSPLSRVVLCPKSSLCIGMSRTRCSGRQLNPNCQLSLTHTLSLTQPIMRHLGPMAPWQSMRWRCYITTKEIHGSQSMRCLFSSSPSIRHSGFSRSLKHLVQWTQFLAHLCTREFGPCRGSLLNVCK